MGMLMVMVNLALMVNSSDNVQELVEAQLDASRERFNFSKTQTRSMLITKNTKGQPPPEPSVELYGATIETSSNKMHLGISRIDDSTNEDTVSNRIKTAHRTSYKLMGAGLHGAYGVGSEITKHLWSI